MTSASGSAISGSAAGAGVAAAMTSAAGSTISGSAAGAGVAAGMPSAAGSAISGSGAGSSMVGASAVGAGALLVGTSSVAVISEGTDNSSPGSDAAVNSPGDAGVSNSVVGLVPGSAAISVSGSGSTGSSASGGRMTGSDVMIGSGVIIGSGVGSGVGAGVGSGSAAVPTKRHESDCPPTSTVTSRSLSNSRANDTIKSFALFR